MRLLVRARRLGSAFTSTGTIGSRTIANARCNAEFPRLSPVSVSRTPHYVRCLGDRDAQGPFQSPISCGLLFLMRCHVTMNGPHFSRSSETLKATVAITAPKAGSQMKPYAEIAPNSTEVTSAITWKGRSRA